MVCVYLVLSRKATQALILPNVFKKKKKKCLCITSPCFSALKGQVYRHSKTVTSLSLSPLELLTWTVKVFSLGPDQWMKQHKGLQYCTGYAARDSTFTLEHAAHSPTNKTVRHCRNCCFASQNMGSNNFSCLVCGTCVTQKWEDFLGLCIWVQTLMSLHECMLLYKGTVRPPCLPVRVADVHSTSEYGPNLLFTTFEPNIVWLNTLTLQ